MVHVRARRVSVALATVILGLLMTAAPASAKVRVGIENNGSEPVTVTVGGPAITVNVTSGCDRVPSEDVTLAVCLPGGGFLVFALNPGSTLFGAD